MTFAFARPNIQYDRNVNTFNLMMKVLVKLQSPTVQIIYVFKLFICYYETQSWFGRYFLLIDQMYFNITALSSNSNEKMLVQLKL